MWQNKEEIDEFRPYTIFMYFRDFILLRLGEMPTSFDRRNLRVCS